MFFISLFDAFDTFIYFMCEEAIYFILKFYNEELVKDASPEIFHFLFQLLYT